MKSFVIFILLSLFTFTLVGGQGLHADDDLEKELESVKSDLQNIEAELANATSLEGKLELIKKLYADVDIEDIKEQVVKNLQGHPLESVLKQNPKIIDFVSRLLKDDQALLSLSEILKMRNHLIGYFIFFILTWIMKIKVKRRYRDYYLTTRFIVGISNFVIFTLIRLSAFYLIFKEQLDPAIDIFKTSFS